MDAALQEELRATFADSFMKPKCYKGSDIQEALIEEGLDAEDDSYYGRLSADGYLDATEWTGPYETPEDVARALIDLYGPE